MAATYDDSTINIVLVIIIIIIIFFDPGTQFPRKEKITLCNIKKYKNQAGMNLTPPSPIIIIIIIIIVIIYYWK